jgi:hypothetical protein
MNGFLEWLAMALVQFCCAAIVVAVYGVVFLFGAGVLSLVIELGSFVRRAVGL